MPKQSKKHCRENQAGIFPCVREILKVKGNMGVSFGMEMVKRISHYPNFSTSAEPHAHPCPEGLGQQQYILLDVLANIPHPPIHTRLRSSDTPYRTNPAEPLEKQNQHRRNTASTTLPAHPRSTRGQCLTKYMHACISTHTHTQKRS